MSALMPHKSGKYGSEFDAAFSRLFPSLQTRSYISKVLSQYDIGFISPQMLVRRLMEVINDPKQLEFFDVVRTIILLRDQLEFGESLPVFDLNRTKRVKLTRAFLHEDFGFKIAGGMDQNCPPYISWVEQRSKAWRAALRKGHQITRVNGLSVTKSTHNMIVDYFKISYHLELEVKYVGMVPRNTKNLELGWTFTDVPGKDQQVDSERETGLYFKRLNSAMIGLHVRNTVDGIMVVTVKPNSDAEEAKIQAGDIIVEMNGKRLEDRDFMDCLAILSCDPPFLMKIKRPPSFESTMEIQ